MCGVTFHQVDMRIMCEGLSPRVRGNRCHRGGGDGVCRSIPACAGKPSQTASRTRGATVYPRVCGETQLNEHYAEDVGGLSPRVRGNRGSPSGESSRKGSIPACAGKPSARGYAWYTYTVYPRVCGETTQLTHSSVKILGLSPRVRGNRSPIRATTSTTRSIPACAGKPWKAPAPCSEHRVYPRVCGETGGERRIPLTTTSLSPRVRGNPDGPGGGALCSGSIPACAGKPQPSSAAF